MTSRHMLFLLRLPHLTSTACLVTPTTLRLFSRHHLHLHHRHGSQLQELQEQQEQEGWEQEPELTSLLPPPGTTPSSQPSSSRGAPRPLLGVVLDSTNLCRKYLGPLDVIFTLLLHSIRPRQRQRQGQRQRQRGREGGKADEERERERANDPERGREEAKQGKERERREDEEEEDEEEEEEDGEGEGEEWVVLSPRPWQVWHAMAAHHSQFVWFRRLFVCCSRFTFVNSFKIFHKS